MNVDDYLSAFSARNPEPLATTPRASLWRVDTDYGPSVLKVLSDRGLKAGERIGALALQEWKGDGAAHLYELHDQAMLLEYLHGPCIGEIVTIGHHVEAAPILANLAIKLRKPASVNIRAMGFIAVQNNFDAALTKADIASFPLRYQTIFIRARRIWHSLIESTQEYCLLHGDLNLDNVLQSPRGWMAIDPKGLIGDPCYEFAITFRTPFNKPEITASRERIKTLAKIYSSQTGLDELRILQFGFAHVALSLSWHLSRGNYPSADLELLKTFDSLGLI